MGLEGAASRMSSLIITGYPMPPDGTTRNENITLICIAVLVVRKLTFLMIMTMNSSWAMTTHRKLIPPRQSLMLN
jgi:hypothetical protein